MASEVINKVFHILAKDQYQNIGNFETKGLPWKCKKDMDFFRKMTLGNVVIMGRVTFESIGCKPLPNRINIVVSKTKTYDNVLCFTDVVAAVSFARTMSMSQYDEYRTTSEPAVFIIGGAEIYKSTLGFIDGAFCSYIDNPVELDVNKAVKFDWGYTGVTNVYPIDFGLVETEENGVRLERVVFYKRSRAKYVPETGFPEDLKATEEDITDYTTLVRTLLKKYYKKNELKKDRTGTGTISIFGANLSFDVRSKAPFITQRKIPLKSTLGELMWFILGKTDVTLLKEKFKCNYWDEWADEETNSIGPMYGYQWRNSSRNGIFKDQLLDVLHQMVHTPYSRRMVVSAWEPTTLPNVNIPPNKNPSRGNMALAPCHFAFQLYIEEDKLTDTRWVSLMWHQRSADVLMGLPVNIASYYFLLCILCKAAEEKSDGGFKYKPYELKCSLGDAHLYSNHIDEALRVQRRHCKPLAVFTAPEGAYELINDKSVEIALEYQKKAFNSVKGYLAHENVKLARNV